MKFVSLISRPLGHPAALCFSRLAGLNRRPQSCRTKFIEEWHFSGQLWTHYIWHHFNWEKIGALPILSQENHISCCCQYTSGIFQGIWLNSNNSTNLLQKSRANTSQGINCISAADTKEFGPQNRTGILSLNHCQVPPTKDSGLFAGIRSFFFHPNSGWLGLEEIWRKKNRDQTHNQQDSSSIHFLSFKCHAFLRQSCSTSLSPLLASTFLRLWQQSLLSHWASSWFAAFICGHDSAEQLESQKFKQWDPNPTGWLCLTTDIRRIYIYTYVYIFLLHGLSAQSPLHVLGVGSFGWATGSFLWSWGSTRTWQLGHPTAWNLYLQIQSFDSIQYSSVLFMWLRLFFHVHLSPSPIRPLCQLSSPAIWQCIQLSSREHFENM